MTQTIKEIVQEYKKQRAMVEPVVDLTTLCEHAKKINKNK